MEEKKYIVYKHTSPEGGVYIGQTSLSLKRRSHPNGSGYLRANKHGEFYQKRFADAIIKYGWDNFTHEIIYHDLTKKESIDKELELIKEYSQSGICYNIDGVDREARKCDAINMYSLNGELLMQWNSISEAVSALGFQRHTEANISACCLGRKHRAYGYIWRYKNSDLEVKPMSPYRRPICQFNQKGKYVATYKSVNEAGKAIGRTPTSIGNALHGWSKTCGGYIWKFLDDLSQEEKISFGIVD